MNNSIRSLLATSAPASTILIRLLVGCVFLSEGIQKFLFPDALGVGRFLKIGIPSPEVMAPFSGGLEIVCGGLVIVGLLTRPATLALFLNISVAIVSTKIPILLGYGFGGFDLPKMAHYGFWPMAHEGRADFCMLLGSLFLLIVGAGVWSLDARFAPRASRT
ncbi:MAG: DoxX family protein [Chthoniobacterales bacterium]|nr:MAG: DoxX family protein [Chthoniobacterales bacterium]